MENPLSGFKHMLPNLEANEQLATSRLLRFIVERPGLRAHHTCRDLPC